VAPAACEVIAENLLLKRRLVILRRARRRPPKLSVIDRLLCGFESLCLTAGRFESSPSPSVTLLIAGVRDRTVHELITTGTTEANAAPGRPRRAATARSSLQRLLRSASF